jgi:hypothetical protein
VLVAPTLLVSPNALSRQAMEEERNALAVEQEGLNPSDTQFLTTAAAYVLCLVPGRKLNV